VRKSNAERTDWKVYKPADVSGRRGDFSASFKEPSDAAVMIAFYGNGAQIRYKHHTLVWNEGKEDQPASNSYDHVAGVCIDRVNAIIRAGAEQARRANEVVIAARKARGEQ